MSAELMGWHDEHSLDHRRRMRNGMCVSLAIHGLVLASFAVSTPHVAPPFPDVLAVDLVAAPPSGAAPPAPSRAQPEPPAAAEPAAPEPPPPAPEPPPPEPAPPIPKAPVQVLPEETPAKLRQVEPEPKVVAKVEPKPKPQPKPAEPPRRPRRPRKQESVSMEELLAESGPDDLTDMLRQAREETRQPAESSGEPDQTGGREGTVVSAELAAWTADMKRHIKSRWPVLPSYRGRGLSTTLEIRISPDGRVVGDVRVRRGSGDPYFDDHAKLGVKKSEPLPVPPWDGPVTFNFRSEEN